MTTLSIDNIATSDVDVAVPQLTQSDFELMSTTVDAKAGVTISRYVLPTGNPLYPTTAVVRTEFNPLAKNHGEGTRRSSITLNSWARAVDGDGVILGLRPISVVIAINTPDMDLEADDLSDMIGNAYGLTFPSLTSKVPSTASLSKLLFGLTEIL